MSRIWGGIPGEVEWLQGSHRAQVCVSALQVLLSGRLEGSELASLCSSPDWELSGRSPVHTGPVEHFWGFLLLVGGALVCGHPHLAPSLQDCV